MRQLFAILFISQFTFSQVGINTSTPSADLEVKTVSSSASDKGLTVINSSGTTLFTIYNNGNVVVNSLSGGGNVTADTTGKLVIGDQATIGDIKFGFQPIDHNGWIKLDGRAISLLTATQQISAIILGFIVNIPDAENSYLSQNGSILGSISGSNSISLSQNQLPNITLTGTTSNETAGTPTGNIVVNNTTATMQNAGNHNHTYSDGGATTFGTAGLNPFNDVADNVSQNKTTSTSGNHTHVINPHSHTATFTGNVMSLHNHNLTTSSLNGGVSQVPLTINPQTLSVNVFVYLGY